MAKVTNERRFSWTLFHFIIVYNRFVRRGKAVVEVGKWCADTDTDADNVVLIHSSDIKVAGAKP